MTLIILFFGLFIGCSADDDSSNSTPTQSQSTASPEPAAPQVPDPGTATLSSPTNNEICLEGVAVDESRSSVTFSWNASADTNSYDLTITNQATSESTDIRSIATTSNEVTLEHDASYSWYITSKADGNSTTSQSDIWQFYLAGDGQENHVPFNASTIYPSPGAAVDAVNGVVAIEWEGNDPDPNDLLRYTIYVDSNSESVSTFETPDASQTDLTLTTFDLSVESGQTYYWSIKTTDGENSSYSPVFSFIVN